MVPGLLRKSAKYLGAGPLFPLCFNASHAGAIQSAITPNSFDSRLFPYNFESQFPRFEYVQHMDLFITYEQ